MMLWGRAAVLGFVVVVTGTVSHVSAGGLLPQPVILGLGFLAAVALSTRFLMRPATLRRLVMLVVVGQGMTHVLLSAMAGHRGDRHPAVTTMAPHADLQPVLDSQGRRVGSLLDIHAASHAPADGVSGAPGAGVPMGWLTHQVDHLAQQGAAMVVAHLLGAVALGVWLWIGEAALWHLVFLRAARTWPAIVAQRSLRASLAALVGAHAARETAARRLGILMIWLPPADQLAHPVVTRRGPPPLLSV